MRARLLVLLATVAGAAAAAPPAHAFDTAPHGDITESAMREEGFGQAAIDVARVNNWFTDLYFPEGDVPYSGHADWYKAILGGNTFQGENWPKALVDAADRMHFDAGIVDVAGKPVLVNTAATEREWLRLRQATMLQLRAAKASQSPADLIAVLGISLHPVQDFYAHSNWVEPCCAFASPGWEAKQQGRTPTWFDVPKAARDTPGVNIIPGSIPGNPRGHGAFASDRNASLTTAQAKDWTGRPLHTEAYLAAYFATRQWVQAARGWLGDDALWTRAQRYVANRSALRHDQAGTYNISAYSGHWNGQGGVCKAGLFLCNESSGDGGSVVGLRWAVNKYFEDRGKTIYRRAFERIMQGLAVRDPAGVSEAEVPVATSRPLQASTRFVRLRVTRYRGNDLGDPGPDDADVYARATLGGQQFISAMIQGHDNYAFPRPKNEAFTFIRPVARGALFDELVTALTVRIKTGDVRLAGTNDDVYLRVSPTLRFALDKGLYDDFERGDHDTYSVPIDAITRSGLSIGDLRQVTIEKSRDGVAGGWRLSGVTVTVNGRVVVNAPAINRWLEDNRRTWTAPGFVPAARPGAALGVWLDLQEDDITYFDDDQGDVHPLDARDAVTAAYAPGARPLTLVSSGGERYGGRIGRDGDDATVTFTVDTIDPAPAPLPPLVATPPAASVAEISPAAGG